MKAVGGGVWLGKGWVGIKAVLVGTVGDGKNTAVMVRSGVGKTGSVGVPTKGKLQANAVRVSSPAINKNVRRMFIQPPAGMQQRH
jgi:hypothetical protein